MTCLHRIRRRVGVALPLAIGLAIAHPALATTVVEKDLDALCAEADRVFVGTVGSVESRWDDPARQSIETLVTFRNIEPLFGVDTPEVVLRFGGGQIGDVAEQVGGLPVFTVGDRVVIFAHEGRYVSPIVGFHQGYIRVTGEGENATVASTLYHRLGTLSDGRRLLAGTPQAASTMPLSDFLATVRQRLAARPRGGQ